MFGVLVLGSSRDHAEVKRLSSVLGSWFGVVVLIQMLLWPFREASVLRLVTRLRHFEE